ncbi:putative activating signal cointegrator protein [Proteus phage vB_PmiS_PM-CJR]|nr:putative activating signal cointegrator protein [Proteus phage vB_PmiS_PM-CJR]
MKKMHRIKIYPLYFRQVCSGMKKAELRINDRNYQIGELVIMKEYDPDTKSYTGNFVTVEITMVNDVSDFTNIANQVMFSFDKLTVFQPQVNMGLLS